MNPHSPRLIALLLALLLTACTTPTVRPDAAPQPLPAAPQEAPAVIVAESFMTPPMVEHEVDSVAAWNAPNGDTLLIATGKESNQLLVYDGDSGALLRLVGSSGSELGQFNRPNGIAVYGDLAFVVERDNQRVQVLHLPDFQPVAQFGKGELLTPYGLWLHETAPGELEVLVTDSFMADFRTQLLPPMDEMDGRVKRYRVTISGDVPVATLTGQFGDRTAAGALRMVESIAGDPTHNRLLIAEEDTRVGTTLREYRMDGSYTGRDLPPERFQAQAEGVALWSCADGSGYWITVDQSADRTIFHVFDRETLDFHGSFKGKVVALTDGITLHSVATRRFPEGVLYAAHDDRGVGAFDWRDIATALNLRQNCSSH